MTISEKHLAVLAALTLGTLIVWLITTDADGNMSAGAHSGATNPVQTLANSLPQ